MDVNSVLYNALRVLTCPVASNAKEGLYFPCSQFSKPETACLKGRLKLVCCMQTRFHWTNEFFMLIN